MRLQKEFVDIKDVIFDTRTFIKDGTLFINKEELLEKIIDPRFARVEIHLAFPGGKKRISRVGDIIQPMVKTEDEEMTFPGSLGKLVRAGNGKTRILRGVTVLETYEMDAPGEAFLDMSGPGAVYTMFSKTINVVIRAIPADGVDKYNYVEALKKASLTAAKYLASAAGDCSPNEVREYKLKDSTTNASGALLPKVVYIYQIFSHKQLVEPLFYGNNCKGMLPIIVHPNEILDGALVNRNYEQLNNGDVTHIIQNHPVIEELYRRDGKDLNFAGVIMTNAPAAMVDKERSTMLAAGLAKYILKADAAIITKEGGGHPQVDMSLHCEKCEELGIKTVMILTEFMTTGGSSEESLLFNSPKANAIVSAGCLETVDYPEMEVIGEQKISNFAAPLNSAFKAYNRDVRGSLSQLGESWMTSFEY